MKAFNIQFIYKERCNDAIRDINFNIWIDVIN